MTQWLIAHTEDLYSVPMTFTPPGALTNSDFWGNIYTYDTYKLNQTHVNKIYRHEYFL